MEEYSNFMDLFTVTIWVLIFLIVFMVIAYFLSSFAYYKLFKKAKMDSPAIRGFVPFYNIWSLVELSECHWIYFLIILLNNVVTAIVRESNFSFIVLIMSLLALYVQFCINYNIAKKFKVGTGYAVGMTLFPLIFYLILGLSNQYTFNSDVKVNKWGYYDFENKNVKTKKYCSECGSEMDGDFCPKCGKKGE